jgi:hypothetical protein
MAFVKENAALSPLSTAQISIFLIAVDLAKFEVTRALRWWGLIKRNVIVNGLLSAMRSQQQSLAIRRPP